MNKPRGMTAPGRRRARLASTIAMTGAALVLASCSGGDEGGGNDEFTIGAVLPVSGPYSQYADFMTAGLEEGVARVNADGGIDGRKVKLKIRDDGGDPGQGRLAAQELVEKNQVDFLYADVISGVSLAILPYTSGRKVVTFSNGATPEIGDVKKYPYSFQYNDLAPERVVAVSAALKKLGATKVGVLVSTNPPQEALGKGLKESLTSKYDLGFAGLQSFAVDAKDLTAQLQRLRTAGADAIAFDGAGNDNVATVMSGMESLDWDVPVVSEPAALHGNLAEQVPSDLADQFYAVQFRVGAALPDQPESVPAYIDALKARGKITNLVYSAVATDTIQLIKWAYEEAASSGKADADGIRKALEGISDAKFSQDQLLTIGNPQYSADDHSTSSADYCNLWALIKASDLVDGQYEGEALSLKGIDDRCS